MLCLSFLKVIANEQKVDYFNKSKKGWFWGEEMIKNKKNNIKEEKYNKNIIVYRNKEYKTIPREVDIPWNFLDSLDPDEISKLENLSKKISIMYPTNKNVLEYKKIQKYLINKALVFTNANMLISKQNSLISNWVAKTSMRSPYEINAKRKNKLLKQREFLNSYKNKIIILVAIQKGCTICKKQVPILEKFKKSFDIGYKLIDIEKNTLFLRKYKVNKTPDLFLLLKNSNNKASLIRFAIGLQTVSDIKSGVVSVLNSLVKNKK